jgi:hypothetical protein
MNTRIDCLHHRIIKYISCKYIYIYIYIHEKTNNNIHSSILIYSFFFVSYLNYYSKNNNIDSFTTRKRIAFCIVGQIRTNSCVSDYSENTYMKDSWNNNVFTDELKENCDYDVFISCDKNINIEKTKEYFGEHLKNIHIINDDSSDSGYYMIPIQNKIPTLDNIFKNNVKYNEKNGQFMKGIYQHYKLYDALHLMNSENTEYDYIIKLRFDNVIEENILDYINTLNNDPSVELYAYWDMFAIGRSTIMKWYLSLLPRFGEYDFTKQRHNMKHGMYGPAKDYYTIGLVDKMILEDHAKDYYSIGVLNRMIPAAEHQLTEHIYKYCNDNHLDIDSTVKEIKKERTILITGRICDGPWCSKNSVDKNIHYMYPPIVWAKK